MPVSKAGALILIAGLVVACGESSTEVDDFLVRVDLAPTSPGGLLLGTIGAGGTLSTLIAVDPLTGATLSTIGPVGFVVNGMEFDPTTGTLYGSTSITDPTFNGLITIDLETGAGTPVSTTSGFGLSASEAINNITIDASGQLFGWWEPAKDDLVRIDKVTGIATLVGDADPVFTGFSTFNGGLDFDNSGILYVNSAFPPDFHIVDPVLGPARPAGTLVGRLPIDDFDIAHHGDFHPVTNVFYALSETFGPRDLLLVDITTFTVTSAIPLEDEVHVITWLGVPEAEEECPTSVRSGKSGKSGKGAVAIRARSEKSVKSAKSGKCRSRRSTKSGKSEKSKKSGKSKKSDSECKGGVTSLTLLYSGPSGNIVVMARGGDVLFSAPVPGGTPFTFTGLGGERMGTEIMITVDESDPVDIHTSCSRPIGVGSVFGAFEVLAGSSRDGGPFEGGPSG